MAAVQRASLIRWFTWLIFETTKYQRITVDVNSWGSLTRTLPPPVKRGVQEISSFGTVRRRRNTFLLVSYMLHGVFVDNQCYSTATRNSLKKILSALLLNGSTVLTAVASLSW